MANMNQTKVNFYNSLGCSMRELKNSVLMIRERMKNKDGALSQFDIEQDQALLEMLEEQIDLYVAMNFYR